MTSDTATYPGHRFPAEIISHAVWLYHVFSLNLRDVGGVEDRRGGVSLPVGHWRRHRQVERSLAAWVQSDRWPG